MGQGFGRACFAHPLRGVDAPKLALTEYQATSYAESGHGAREPPSESTPCVMLGDHRHVHMRWLWSGCADRPGSRLEPAKTYDGW